MAADKLILYPALADGPAIDSAALLQQLEAIGLIGAAFRCQGETRYLAGERFLQLVTFLGCSPLIELEPPVDADTREADCATGRFCHLRLALHRKDIRFRSSVRAPLPRCPRCRQPETRWPELLQHWETHPGHSHWTCTACGHAGRLYDLNFRRHAGFARGFIEIWGIYPSEAVPGEALLSALQAFGDGGWRHMYIRD